MRPGSAIASRQQLERTVLVALDEDVPEVPDGPAAGDAVSHLRRELDRALEMGDGRLDLARIGRKPARLPAKRKLVGRVRGDLQGQLHVAERVGRRRQRPGPRRSGAQRHPGLRRDGGSLLAAGLGAIRLDVVLRQHAGQLVVAERLEVPGGGKVPRATVALRQRAVGDLLDEALDEPILAALRRAGVVVEGDELSPREAAEASLNLVRGEPGDGRQRIGAERQPDDRCVLEQAALGRVEPVQARRDERVERLRHGERGEVADRLVRAIGLLQAAVVEEHAHRLDRVERDALGALPRSSRAALSGRPGTRPPSSSSISASVSGSRPSDVKPRWPAPQVGRRSRSSGRARVMT